MDCFKLKPGANRVFLIAQSEYLQQTKIEEPYCNHDEKGGDHFYAVCPECDNPIQIIGLFRDTLEAGKKPYGRHHFFFLCHEKRLDADGNHLEESIDFEVTSENECIYRKTIEIRTDYFLNLIHLPEVRAHRNEGYLEIAHTLIDPSLFR